MTEEEAKTKWCPMVRFLSAPATDSPNMLRSNRGAGHMDAQIANYSCVGSACMMWREHWAQVTMEDEDAPGDFGHRYETHGHCGLAGKP